MANIKLVVEIPEEIYKHYKKVWQKRRGSIPESCIAFGTPLPKDPRWIPVSERLPEDYEEVIASTNGKYVYQDARYSTKYGWEFYGDYYWKDLTNVDAWMPLPEAYKPESEEEDAKID